MKVYLVSNGEYDDYTIEGVFSTREKAQKFIDSIKDVEDTYYSPYIEETELDSMYNFVCRDKYKSYTVQISEEDTIFVNANNRPFEGCFDRNLYNNSYMIHPDGTMFFDIKTDDEQKAIKIAIDKKKELINTNQYKHDKNNFEVYF